MAIQEFRDYNALSLIFQDGPNGTRTCQIQFMDGPVGSGKTDFAAENDLSKKIGVSLRASKRRIQKAVKKYNEKAKA